MRFGQLISGAKTKMKVDKEDSDDDFLYVFEYLGCTGRLKDANTVSLFFLKGHMRCPGSL